MNQKPSRIASYAGLAYGLLCYAGFLGVFVFFILFSVGLFVPKTVDDGPLMSWPAALSLDCGLMLLFAVQHTIMARPAFKRVWKRWLPASVERSTFVLSASACVALLIAGWAPLPGELWRTENVAAVALLWTVCAAGWLTLLISTFLIDHFELFGLKQVWVRRHGAAVSEAVFKTPGLYRMVRHPMMLGFLLGFWATPRMTTSHFVLAAGMTLYILVGITFEERDLIRQFGERYRRYQRAVPGLFPRPRARPHPKAAKTELGS